MKDFRSGFQAYNERGRVFRTLLFRRGLGVHRRFKMCNTLKYCFSTLLGQPDHAHFLTEGSRSVRLFVKPTSSGTLTGSLSIQATQRFAPKISVRAVMTTRWSLSSRRTGKHR